MGWDEGTDRKIKTDRPRCSTVRLHLDQSPAEGYKSKSQRTRVITEAWAANELYCPACTCERLEAHTANKRVEDYYCPTCDRRVQLKAKRNRIGRKVANSAYEPKIEAIRENRMPDYAFMIFDPDAWIVTRLIYVPGHFITESVVEARKPLSSKARRAGWRGSNILLDRIPRAGRIPVVAEATALPSDFVRSVFQETAFVEELPAESRGWFNDVLECVERLGLQEGERFELADVYAFEEHLSQLHPENQHVKAKIRQQLQVLRDEGFIEFLGDGEYRWTKLRME